MVFHFSRTGVYSYKTRAEAAALYPNNQYYFIPFFYLFIPFLSPAKRAH